MNRPAPDSPRRKRPAGTDEAPAGPRNLVLLFDGTGDWLGSDETNVARLFRNLVEDDRQIVFYDGGIGTLTNAQALTTLQRGALRLLDLALATGLRDKVLEGYRSLVEHYRPGDRIYLFGFSRGAFTARLVAAMVENFGLLRPEHRHLAPYLWQTLANLPPDRRADELLKPAGAFKRIARKLKAEFSRGDVEIRFMGLFDTVSSVGVVRRFNVYPNTDYNPSVRRVCHAVAIDERRNAFPEALMHPQQPGLTEVWFPGVHRDVGGGLPKGRRRIADEALVWIESEARLACARFAERTRSAGDDEPPAPNYPANDPYVLLGLYPMKMFVRRVSDFRLVWPNFSHTRVVPEGALVHTLADEMKGTLGYDPPNLPAHRRRFPDDVQEPRDSHYRLPPTRFRLEEGVGIFYGVLLLLLNWNAHVGGGMHWRFPAWAGKGDEATLTAWAKEGAWALVLLYLAAGVLAPRLLHRRAAPRRSRAEGPLGAVGLGLALLLVLVAILLEWREFLVATGVGLGFALAAQGSDRACRWLLRRLPGRRPAPRPKPVCPRLASARTLPWLLWGMGGATALVVATDLLPNAARWEGRFAPTLLLLAVVAALIDVATERRNLLRAERNDADDRYGIPAPEADLRAARPPRRPPRPSREALRTPGLTGALATLGLVNLPVALAIRLVAFRVQSDERTMGLLPVAMLGLANVAFGLFALLDSDAWHRLKAPAVQRDVLRRIREERRAARPNRPRIEGLRERYRLNRRFARARLYRYIERPDPG